MIQLKIESQLYPFAFLFPLLTSCNPVVHQVVSASQWLRKKQPNGVRCLDFRKTSFLRVFAMFLGHWYPCPSDLRGCYYCCCCWLVQPTCGNNHVHGLVRLGVSLFVEGFDPDEGTDCHGFFSFDIHIVMFVSWVQIPEWSLSSFHFLHLQLIQLEC